MPVPAGIQVLLLSLIPGSGVFFGTGSLLVVMAAIHVVVSLTSPGFFWTIFGLWPRALFTLQIWRLVTSSLLHGGIGHLIMNSLSLIGPGAALEPVWGTSSFFYHILLFAVLTGIVFVLLSIVLYLVGYRSQLDTVCVGLSCVLFTLMVIQGQMDSQRLLPVLGLVPVPAWLFPWVMLFVMSYLVPQCSFVGHLAGIIVGYLYVYGAFASLLPPDATFANWEATHATFTLNAGYILAKEAGSAKSPAAFFFQFPWAVVGTGAEAPGAGTGEI
jgi:rhomboid domain-containing protein 1